MQLYDELRSHFHIPDAYRQWAQYRNLLSEYLAGEADNLPTLAILGAGACNDIDLLHIRQFFSEITLIDYDSAAMEEAVKRYGLKQDACVSLLPAGLTGIGEAAYEKFCLSMQSYAGSMKDKVTVQEFDIYAISVLQTLICSSGKRPLENKQYDYIWCVGVHSQLNAMFSYIYRVFWENLRVMGRLTAVPEGDGPEDSAFMTYLRELNTVQIRQFNEDILRAAQKRAYIGCEIGRCNAYYEGIHPAAENRAFAYLVEGARQGILDIRKKGVKIDESVICWPFYPENRVYYDMLFQRITMSDK